MFQILNNPVCQILHLSGFFYLNVLFTYIFYFLRIPYLSSVFTSFSLIRFPPSAYQCPQGSSISLFFFNYYCYMYIYKLLGLFSAIPMYMSLKLIVWVWMSSGGSSLVKADSFSSHLLPIVFHVEVEPYAISLIHTDMLIGVVIMWVLCRWP